MQPTTTHASGPDRAGVRCPREELEEMVQRWLEANRRGEAEGDWARHLGPLYTDDAEYRWAVGPGEEFVARGRSEIERWACGVQMKGFEGWTYPYDRVVIDEAKGEVVGFWRQVSPFRRPDGSAIEVPGVGCSWFRYAGGQRWCWQRDLFDLMSVFATLMEINAQGQLSAPLKQKIAKLARGGTLEGHERVRPPIGLLTRVRQGAALARVALLGR